jgi:hypothetical protein
MRQSPHPNPPGEMAGRCPAPNLPAANGGEAGTSPPNPPNRLGLAVEVSLALKEAAAGSLPSSFPSSSSSSSGTVDQGSADERRFSGTAPGLRTPSVPGLGPAARCPNPQLQGVVGPSPTPQLGVVRASASRLPKTRPLAAL